MASLSKWLLAAEHPKWDYQTGWIPEVEELKWILAAAGKWLIIKMAFGG
jgi:hypothetical protein